MHFKNFFQKYNEYNTQIHSIPYEKIWYASETILCIRLIMKKAH